MYAFDSFHENVLLQNYKFFFHRCNSILKSNGEYIFCNSIFNLSPGKILYFVTVSFFFRLGDSDLAWSFFKPKAKLLEEQLSHWFEAHFLMLRSHANFSTKSWGFVGSGSSNFLFSPLASKTQFL